MSHRDKERKERQEAIERQRLLLKLYILEDRSGVYIMQNTMVVEGVKMKKEDLG